MRTRSSSFAQILEQRKRKAQRQQRELELLLETAGIDRPNITDFEVSTSRRTRRASASQTPESPPRSSKVQVVIKSDASLLRKHSHLQTTSRKLKEPPDKKVKSKGVDPFKEAKSSATATSDVDPSESAENQAKSSTSEVFARTNQLSKKPGTLLHWSLPSDLRKRQQLNLVRKTTSQDNLKRTSKSKIRQLHELEKAIRKLEARQRVAQVKSSNWQQFSAPIPSKAPRLSQDLCQQIFPPRSNISPEKESLPPETIVAAERESIGLVLVSQSTTPRNKSPTKPSSMSRQPEDDHEMSAVDTNSAVESKTYPLTDECQHYERRDEVPWDIQKYWSQRYSIFSMYDEGIYMTDDAWFGVTPEPVANKVASDLAASNPSSKTVVIDIFAGAGGNAIAFALSDRWSTVIAIEKNPSVIACAQHNANIYGVSDRITWINDDCFSYLKSNQSSIDPAKTVIFASPPWGGPGYSSDAVFNLKTMSPYSAKDIHLACKGMTSALYLPRTSDLKQIARLAPAGQKVEVVQYCMEGASKALVAYIPAAA